MTHVKGTHLDNWYAQPTYEDSALWGVYYNVDHQSEDFESGEDLPGMHTEVIVEGITPAQAKLIAAAPSLLLALKVASQYIGVSTSGTTDHPEMIEAINQAINKATA